MPYTDDSTRAASHTPEPWDCDRATTMYATPDESDAITMIEVRANVTHDGWDTVAFIEAIWPGARANALRIVAAVNACKGISTEALEQGVITELQQCLISVRQEAEEMAGQWTERFSTIMQMVDATVAKAQKA